MKSTRTLATGLIATAALSLLCLSSGPAEAAEAPVTARAQTPTHSFNYPGVRGAMAAAARGPDALRHYVYRTRMIYALTYEEFAPR